MEFEWDPVKSDACFLQREFDFEFVARAFFDPARVVHFDDRFDYGEPRFRLLGQIQMEGGPVRVFFVAYTMRGETIRIISARRANSREVRSYEHHSHHH